MKLFNQCIVNTIPTYLTFYFDQEKIDIISMVLSKAEVPFILTQEGAISITFDNNIKTALDALVNSNLMKHDWKGEIITYFPSFDGGFQRLSGHSFFKFDKQKLSEQKEKLIETQLDALLEVQCSFLNMGSFGGSFIFLPKDTNPERLEKYIHILQEANIPVKIEPDKEQPCLRTNKKETMATLIDKLENANFLKSQFDM